MPGAISKQAKVFKLGAPRHDDARTHTLSDSNSL